MKAKYFFLLLSLAFISAKAQMTYPQSNINLIGFCNPETVAGVDAIKYSGCWGWNQTSKNKEYAIVGSSKGTYFIDISAPATPTVCDYVPGAHPTASIWREMKTYQNYCYIVSDDAAPNSFQIIDMQYLPDSVHVVYDGKTTYFERGHTCWVDGNKLYVGGITLSGGGAINMRVYSLATPTAPALIRTLSQDFPSVSYVHDMLVKNDTVYASCGNQGLRVYRLTPSNTFTAIGSLTSYPQSGYNHSSSMTADGKTLIFCDEVPTNLAIKAADITNLTSITVPALFRPNMNAGFCGHNPYVVGNKYVFVSCYQDGLNLYDISSPLTPTLAGFFDTHPQGGASAGNNYGSSSYNGNWGAYPWFKSGLILACDMQNGVFILGADAFKPVASFNVPPNICSNTAITFTDVTSNTPTSWSWSIPGASPGTSTLQNPTISYPIGGVYTVTLLSSNATGTNSVVKTVTVTLTPTITCSGISPICAGNSTTLTAAFASSYTFNPGGVAASSIVVTPTSTTTYSITGANGTCYGNTTKLVTVNPLPTVNAITNNTLLCVGQTSTLTASGASTYTWNPGGAGTSIVVSPTVTTTYSVTGTSTAGCNKTITITQIVSNCVGIMQFGNESSEFGVFPNPTKGVLTVTGKIGSPIRIYNAIGELVLSTELTGISTEINLSSQPDGIYLVKIGAVTKKIVKD